MPIKSLSRIRRIDAIVFWVSARDDVESVLFRTFWTRYMMSSTASVKYGDAVFMSGLLAFKWPRFHRRFRFRRRLGEYLILYSLETFRELFDFSFEAFDIVSHYSADPNINAFDDSLRILVRLLPNEGVGDIRPIGSSGL